MRETIAIMRKTMVPMPVGSARSYMQILDGNNLCTSLLLLLCGVLLLVLASAARSLVVDRLTQIIALALAGMSIISAVFFFPIPVVFSGLAAVLSFGALTRPESKP